ncbi:MAG: hypothetical protein ACRD1J_05205 [Terriglobia bacterium]
MVRIVEARWRIEHVYREKLRALVHRDSGRSFRLGDRIRVRLDRIDRTGNKLLFSVPEKAKARRK